ncbi:MAG TPA: hypothetical protein VGE35_01660 [Candidatus Paceibacterota bacterium]
MPESIPPVPEPVHHKIGPAPGTPPFRVVFLPINLGFENPLTDHGDQIRALQHFQGLRRLLLHLGGAWWVSHTGDLSKEHPDPLFGKKGYVHPVILLADFSSVQTELSASQLPKAAGPIEKLNSGFSLEPWRICLNKSGDKEWHDHIKFENGKFYIESIRIEHDRAAAVAAATTA